MDHTKYGIGERDIKFRAWIHHLRLMVNVESIDLSHQVIECYLTDREEGDLSCYEFHEITLMQYTGLKDKDGKEVYEGDIVDIVELPFPSEFENIRYGLVVSWIKGRWFAAWERDGDNVSFPYPYVELVERPQWYEVTGNVFETPELLNETP